MQKCIKVEETRSIIEIQAVAESKVTIELKKQNKFTAKMRRV